MCLMFRDIIRAYNSRDEAELSDIPREEKVDKLSSPDKAVALPLYLA